MSSVVRVQQDGLDVVDVTLVADTNAYADNDVLAVAQALSGVFRSSKDVRILDSVVLLDEAGQGVDVDLIFFDGAVTLGTINEAVSISDADARKVVGFVSVVAADYTDLVNSKVAVKTDVGLLLKADGDATDLYVGAVVRSGTPTFAASSLKLKLGFR